MKRLYNLDYLRGLSALGIMIYHYSSWSNGNFSAETFMGRFGIYGVSIFYVLSGLTLFHVYYSKMQFSLQEIIFFFKKRVFRIFPLLWIVTLLTIALSRKIINFTDLFLNLSGLFGFISWDKYFATGGWSIGNEIVFYTFFPFFVLCIKKFKFLMFLIGLIILGLYLYFAFLKLNTNSTLSEQWTKYVNPLNHVFFFLGGVLIGYFFKDVFIKNFFIIVLLFLGITFFVFYPSKGDTINIVTGISRLIFTACCLLICFCFYKMTFNLPKFVHQPLALLGEISYSVYLIHPIILNLTLIASRIFIKVFFYFPESVSLILSVVFTIIISYYSYQYFEKYFIKLVEQKNKELKYRPK